MAKKSANTNVSEPINNLVIVSDTHVGCQLGLCHPDGARLDEGGVYMPNREQLVVWKWWTEFWDEWVPDVCRGEPFAVCFNGDAIDGEHHRSTHQWTHSMADQGAMAEKILRPVVEKCNGLYYHIRGTEAHVGPSGVEEERLAKALGAIPNECGQYARNDLWIRIGRGLAIVMHHIGTAGSMHYESTAIMRELTEAYVEAGRWGDEPPDWVVRGHRHRNAEVRVQTWKGFCTAFTTAAWQLKTPYVYKVAGARQSLSQIGGSVLRCGDEDLYTRHRVWSIKRSKEEMPCQPNVGNVESPYKRKTRRRPGILAIANGPRYSKTYPSKTPSKSPKRKQPQSSR
jgi:hypothetical protein